METDLGKPLDEFSRPVHWVLWSEIAQTALICSDYETDKILQHLRAQTKPKTYLMTYAAPVSKAMLIFDTLNFYTYPSLPKAWRASTWLVRDLGIFAGRLYFDFDDQYDAVCAVLGLSQEPSSSEERKIEPFSPSPLPFMQEWLAIRRKGQDFSRTMMGELCRGRRVKREDTVEQVSEAEQKEEVETKDESAEEDVDEEDEGTDGEE